MAALANDVDSETQRRLDLIWWSPLLEGVTTVRQQLARYPVGLHSEVELLRMPSGLKALLRENDWVWQASLSDDRNFALYRDLEEKSWILLAGKIVSNERIEQQGRVARRITDFYLQLHQGQMLPLYPEQWARPLVLQAANGTMGSRQLVLVEVLALDDPHGLIGKPHVVEPFHELPLPNYGQTPAIDLLHSRYVLGEIDQLDLRPLAPSLNGYDLEQFRGLLRSIHAPRTFTEAEYGRSEEVRGFVRVVLGVEETPSPKEAPSRPPARLIRTDREAEEYAAEFMEFLGFEEVAVTPIGPDGGVDVNSDRGIAQVKMEAKPVGRPVIQQTFGIAISQGKSPLVFSVSGFTAEAVAWAEEHGVACWAFERDGSLNAISTPAILLERLAGVAD